MEARNREWQAFDTERAAAQFANERSLAISGEGLLIANELAAAAWSGRSATKPEKIT